MISNIRDEQVGGNLENLSAEALFMSMGLEKSSRSRQLGRAE